MKYIPPTKYTKLKFIFYSLLSYSSRTKQKKQIFVLKYWCRPNGQCLCHAFNECIVVWCIQVTVARQDVLNIILV